MSTPRNPPYPPKKKKEGLSNAAVIAWGVVLSPLIIAVVSVLVLVIALLMAGVLVLPVLALWNWGLVAAAPLVGVTLPTIGLAKAWAVALTIILLRMVTTNSPSQANKNTTAKKTTINGITGYR